VSKVIWQKAASPSCYYLSAACAGQAHSPAAASDQCAMHSCVGIRYNGLAYVPSKVPLPVEDLHPHLTLASLDPRESAPIRHLDLSSRFSHADTHSGPIALLRPQNWSATNGRIICELPIVCRATRQTRLLYNVVRRYLQCG